MIRQIAKGLGWFSIGLGVTEVMAAPQLETCLGMTDATSQIRAYGVREIGSGLAILFQKPNLTGPLWSRVAGDVMDVSTLQEWNTELNPRRHNVHWALAIVAAVTVLDVFSAWCSSSKGY